MLWDASVLDANEVSYTSMRGSPHHSSIATGHSLPWLDDPRMSKGAPSGTWGQRDYCGKYALASSHRSGPFGISDAAVVPRACGEGEPAPLP